jgi:hypothetical protein
MAHLPPTPVQPADLESKVLPVLAGFVSLAFGYNFRNSPPNNKI